MKRLVPLLLLVLLGITAIAYGQVFSDSYTFVRITPPGIYGGVEGINDKMQMVGYYADVRTLVGHGFLYTAGKFTLIDHPGGPTETRGLNNFAQVVGSYNPPSVPPECGQFSTRGFIWQNGKFTPFDFPGACETLPRAINDHGEIVGTMRLGGASIYMGFVYRNGVFQQAPLPSPDASLVDFVSVNNKGLIVGYYYGPNFGVGGLFTYRDGVYTPFTLPDPYSRDMFALGINSQRSIVGFTFSPTKQKYVGFIARNKKLTLLDYPNGLETQLWAINKWGVVAGRSSYIDPKTNFDVTFGIVGIPKRVKR